MTINCKGKLVDLSSPKIMGILNLTPDSFYDGGRYKTDRQALDQTGKMLTEGAFFIDVGGQSTRPTSTFLTAEEEKRRVIPLIDMILKEFPDTLLSVDTFYSEIAKAAVEHGAALINDISAGNLDIEMMSTVAELQVPYIMMHMRGTPQTMQSNTNYTNLLQEILFYFSKKIKQARDMGINDLLVDPGFGFSKTARQNFELLKKLKLFKSLELPILMGVSRKSTIYKTLNISPKEALNGTTALHMLCLLNGANILRVHDVKEARECLDLFLAYERA